MKIKQMIVDADICIKIGMSDKHLFLENLFPSIAEKIYIHRVVYDEIIVPACAKRQLDNMLRSGSLEMLDESGLSQVEMMVYQATYDMLKNVMIDKRNPNKNNGEVCSLAMAKAKSIPVFASDEKELQPIVDEKLNTGIDNIICIRIIDIVKKIKNGELSGLTRKEAKILWVISGNKKDWYDNSIWPI